MFVMHYADLFILVRYVSMTDVGLYTFAYTIGMLISAVWGSFQVYWGAQVFHIMKRHDADEVFARSFTYLLLAVAFCGVGMIVSASPALAILASPAYNGALRLIPLVVLAYCIRSCGEFFRSLFLVEGRPGYDAACTWIASAAGLAAYLILIPRFGVWGAAAGTIATFTIFSAVSVIWTYRLRPYRVETARLLKIGAAAAAPLILHVAVPVPAIGLQVIWAALLILSFPALLLLLGFATREETAVTKSALRGLARFVSRDSRQPVTS
jgi:O-antigen/teichoic acid export membrane protein